MKRKLFSRIICLVLTLAALTASVALIASAEGEYKVIFAVPEEITAIGTQTVASGESVDLPTPDSFTRDGKEYTFVGWSEDEVTDSSVKPAIIEGATYTPEKTTTLYAIYQTGTADTVESYVLVTDASSLAAGDTIVITKSDATYAMSTTQNTSNRGAVAINKSGNTIEINANVQLITLGSDNGYFTLGVDGGYLYAASTTSNHLKVQTTISNRGQWTITVTSAGVATIKANGTAARNWLRFNPNNGTPIFSCYTSGQNDVSIYKKTLVENSSYEYISGVAAECTHTNLDVTETEATKTEPGYRITTCLDCGEEISREQIADALGYAVSYSVPAGLVAPAGINTLSATMPEAVEVAGYTFVGWTTSTVDEATALPTVYTAGSVVDITADTTFYALYSFTDDSASSTTYEKYTGAITEGYYVIAYNTYAMKNTVSSSRLSYATIAPSNNTLENPDANIIWKIEADGTYYTLYNEAANAYAAGTGEKNKAQLLASVTDYAKWTVSGDSTYEFVNLGNADAGVNKNLRNNGAYGFACYSTSTGGALTLYKQTSMATVYTTSPTVGGCEHTNTTTETVDATCTEAGSITVTCNACDKVISEETIPATGHLNTTETTTTEATCTEAGLITETCDDCGATVSTKTVAALGHNYVDGICSRCDEEDPYAGSTRIEFDFGEKGDAGHKDGSELKETETTYTSGSYTLEISDFSKVYGGAYDAMSNSVLKFGTSSAIGTITFTVPNDVTTVIIYVAKYKNNESAISINGGEAQTLTKSSDNGEYDEIAIDTSTNKTVTIATMSGNSRMMLDKIVYIVTSAGDPDCEHVFGEATCTEAPTCTLCGATEGEPLGHSYNTVVTAPTCQDNGYTTYTCSVCGDSYEDEETDTVEHNYVDGACEWCGTPDPDTIDYSGTYYIAGKRSAEGSTYMYLKGAMNGTRYAIFDSTLTELPASITSPDYTLVFVIEKCDDGTYVIYTKDSVGKKNYLGHETGTNTGSFVTYDSALHVTLTRQDDGTFNIHYQDGTTTRYLSINATKGNEYAAWYKIGQINDLTLIPAAVNDIGGASLNIGVNLSIRYHVTLAEGENPVNYSMRFTMNGKSVVVTDMAYDSVTGRYVFTFTGIAPQCMGDSITAELLKNGEMVLTYDGYSVKQYAIDALAQYSDDTELCQLIADLLYYGAAAQVYVGYKTDSLVTDGVAGLGEASVILPTDADNIRDITTEVGADKSVLAFTAAGVRFDYDNKVYVKITTESLDGVTVKVNGTDATIESTDDGRYIVYSDGISALGFDDGVVFTLYKDGNLWQTLTYSVNSYAYGKKDGGNTMADLALALYRYGKSTENYNAE